jgi:hypothetical protein
MTAHACADMLARGQTAECCFGLRPAARLVGD